MKYIDIHAHLNFPEYDDDRAEVIKRTAEAEVGVINIGTDKKTSAEVVKLAEENDNMWAVVGAHPHSVDEGFDYDFYKNLAIHPKVVAIGECGLDYFKLEDEETKVKQQELFKQQIALAKEVGKPLMLHIRDSYEDVWDMLKAESRELKAHLHFFAGSWEVAQKFLARGDTVSFTGVITYPPKTLGVGENLTPSVWEVVKSVPLDRIMSETDSPYVAPVPYRGKRNEPVYVKEVVAKIAEIKGLSVEEVRVAILANSKRVFNLP